MRGDSKKEIGRFTVSYKGHKQGLKVVEVEIRINERGGGCSVVHERAHAFSERRRGVSISLLRKSSAKTSTTSLLLVNKKLLD